MSATPGLKTATPAGRVGMVHIANAYGISGPLGVSPAAQIAVDGSDDAFQQPSSGTVAATGFPGRVVAIGPAPGDYSGNVTLVDSVLMRQHGAGVITFPAAPWDGMEVAVMDADGVATGSPIEAVPGAGGQNIQLVYNLSTFGVTAAIRIPYQLVKWAWDKTLGAWRIVADSASGQLPVYAATNANLALGGRASVKVTSTTTPVTVTMPSTPTEDMRVRVKDVGGAAGTHTITVAAAGGGITIEPLTSFTGGGPGATSTISSNYRGAEWAYDAAAKTWWGVSQL